MGVLISKDYNLFTGESLMNKKPNLYQPKNKRILDEHGNYTKFQEDHEESDAAYERAGTTREEVEEERIIKRMANKKLQNDATKKAVVGQFTDKMLQDEIDKRSGKKTKKKKAAGSSTGQAPMTPSDDDDSDDSGEVANIGGDVNVDNYDDLEPAELKAIAKEKGIPFKPNASKKTMIKLLNADGQLDNN